MIHLICFKLQNNFHFTMYSLIFLCMVFWPATGNFAQPVDEHSHKSEQEHGISLHGTISRDELYEKLSRKKCGHNVPIIKCDNCRYEVGVVKVDRSALNASINIGHVESLEMGITLEATGVVGPNKDRFVIVSPRISGVVNEVFVDWGDRVKKGQKLALLDSIELGEARAKYLNAVAMLKLAKKNYTRDESLFKQNITSKKHFLDAENAYEQAKIELRSMKEKLILMGQAEHEIKKMPENDKHVSSLFTLTAPFDGTIIEKNVAIGELKNAFDPVVTIADLRHLWVWFDVYEKDIPKVKMDSKVFISVASYPEERFEGCVTYIGDTINEKTRTVKVRAEVQNQHRKLKPGMFAEISLQVDVASDSLGLPENAIQTDGQKYFVFVPLKEDYFIRRDVSIGEQVNGYLKVTNGLESNEDVVVKGGFLLKSEIMKEKFGEGCGGN